MGLLVAQVLKTATPNVVIFGRHEEKLAVARTLGLGAQLAEEKSSAGRFDIVVDVTGRSEGLADALKLVRPRGTVVLKSTFHGEAPIETWPIVVEEVTLVGSRCGPFDPAIALLASGAVRIDPLISRVAPLEDFASAFREARSALKVLFEDPSSMTPTVVIAGAGIGGLTLAIALRRRGVPVTVLERAPELRPVGAGLGLGPNAMAALKGLGVVEAIVNAGAAITRSAILDERGRVLGSELDVERMTREVGAPFVALHRTRLHEVLLDALGPGVVRLGFAVTGFERRVQRVVAIGVLWRRGGVRSPGRRRWPAFGGSRAARCRPGSTLRGLYELAWRDSRQFGPGSVTHERKLGTRRAVRHRRHRLR